MKYTTLGSLGDLGKCDWNNPCSDRDRVIYRLEYYTLVWFEHGGKWFDQTITAVDYVTIIYQSWLQLMMQEQGQDKNGPMYKKYGLFGDEWFIMFGGSQDSRAKAGNNKYYADCRMNCVCYGLLNAIFWDRKCTTKVKGPLCFAIEYFVKGTIDIVAFLEGAYSFEVNFYIARMDCENPPNYWGAMLQLWFNPVGAIKKVFTEMQKNLPAIKAFTENVEIKDIQKQIITPLQKNEETGFKNQAIAYGGLGLAGLAGIFVLFKATSKDGSLSLWQWAALGIGGATLGKLTYTKYKEESTLFKIEK